MRGPAYVPAGERLVKRTTAARILRVSGHLVGEMAKRGELEPVQSGNRERRYRLADVLELAELRDAAQAPARAFHGPLSTEDVAKRAGITYAKAWRWACAGYLHPEGGRPDGAKSTGYPLEWSESEALIACRMARLVRDGVSVEKAAEFAREHWPVGPIGEGVRLVVSDG